MQPTQKPKVRGSARRQGRAASATWRLRRRAPPFGLHASAFGLARTHRHAFLLAGQPNPPRGPAAAALCFALPSGPLRTRWPSRGVLRGLGRCLWLTSKHQGEPYLAEPGSALVEPYRSATGPKRLYNHGSQNDPSARRLGLLRQPGRHQPEGN